MLDFRARIEFRFGRFKSRLRRDNRHKPTDHLVRAWLFRSRAVKGRVAIRVPHPGAGRRRCRSYERLVRSRSRVGLRFGDAGDARRKLIAERFFPAERPPLPAFAQASAWQAIGWIGHSESEQSA